jgi:hypothetical protein
MYSYTHSSLLSLYYVSHSNSRSYYVHLLKRSNRQGSDRSFGFERRDWSRTYGIRKLYWSYWSFYGSIDGCNWNVYWSHG